MTSPSTFKALVILKDTSLIITSTFTKKLGCYCTYITGRAIGYTVQKITKDWILLAQTAGTRPFSKSVLPYLIFNRTRNIFEILTSREDGSVPRSQADDHVEASGSLSEKEELAAKA